MGELNLVVLGSSCSVRPRLHAVDGSAEKHKKRGLLDWLRRLRQGKDLDELEEAHKPSHLGRFSDRALGIISSFADPHVNLRIHHSLLQAGVRRVVYSGPIATLTNPGALWDLIQKGDVEWVYGRAERPRLAPELGPLPAGAPEFAIDGVVIRHFARLPDCVEPVRFGDLQWPPPGRRQQEAIEATARDTECRILVIGSGLEYERWSLGPLGDWQLVEQASSGVTEHSVVNIPLPPEEWHVIVHPTSGGSCFSILDPAEHRIVLVVL